MSDPTLSGPTESRPEPPRDDAEGPFFGEAQRPSTGEPFGNQPLRPGEAGGCGKPLVIGCGVVALVLLIALVVLAVKAESLLIWSLEQYRDTVLATLPEDVTAEERARLERGFDALVAAIRQGDLDHRNLQNLQQKLIRTSARVERLRRSDVLELIEALESAAGVDPDSAPVPREPEVEEDAEGVTAAAAGCGAPMPILAFA